jgi:hypothetical protein
MTCTLSILMTCTLTVVMTCTLSVVMICTLTDPHKNQWYEAQRPKHLMAI